jgi:outer membrane protein assembly factor BamB/tetratricopeptide (TPR) repeat protein
LQGLGGATAGGVLVSEAVVRGRGATAGESWPQFRYDDANSGHGLGNTGPDGDIEQRWSFETGAEVFSSPAVVSGTVYLGSNDNKVYAIDAMDGTEQWTFQTDGKVRSSPAVVDGTVYVGSNDHNVYALNAQNGTERWRFQTDGIVFSSPAVMDGTVYVGSYDGNLYAINTENGAQQWSSRGGTLRMSPAVVDSTVQLGPAAFDAVNGTTQWTSQGDNQYCSSPAVADETVYYGDIGGVMYAINAADGTEQWTFQADLSADMCSSPAVVDGTIYVGDYYGNVYAIDATDGTEQWTFRIGRRVFSSPAVVDGTVYIGSNDNKVYAIDATDGTEQWTFQTDGKVRSSPAVVGGTVYVGSEDGKVYALAGPGGNGGQRTVTTTVTTVGETRTGAETARTGSATETATETGTVTGTAATSGETGTMSEIIPLIATLLGLGGGALWYNHRGDDDPSESNSTPETPDAPTASAATKSGSEDDGSGNDGSNDPHDGPTPPGDDPSSESGLDDGTPEGNDTPDSDVFARVNESLEGGDNLRDRGDDHRNAGEYDRAIQSYDEAHAAYEGALSTAAGSSLIDTGEIEAKRDKVADERRETRHQQLTERIESLRDDLERAESLVDDGKFENAREVLSEADSRLSSVRESASGHDFEDLHEEGATLDRHREELLATVAETERREELTDEVERMRSDLDRAYELAERDELEDAREQLEALEPRISDTWESAAEHGFTSLKGEVESLESRREERLEDVIERIEADPVPREIPSVPDMTVEYDALTDWEPIGGGGNADVRKGTFSTPDVEVTLAIKEPRMAGTLHTDAVERMLNEAETWDKLDDHDHIVGIVDYGSEPLPWIAMEYMDGGHLGGRTEEIEIRQALWTALGITKAVRHAHRRGVAHLDLKPENVLFREVEEAWDVPKVADWGLSKHLLEHSKSVEGLSPQYAAPEQFNDAYGPADDITDVYQLGAVFYELFTGEPPFDDAPAKAMRQVLDEPPTPPSEIADVPERLDEVLLTAMAKEKDDRYDSVVYIRDALQELYKDE